MATHSTVELFAGGGEVMMFVDGEDGETVVLPCLDEPPTVVKLPLTQALVRFIALERTRQ